MTRAVYPRVKLSQSRSSRPSQLPSQPRFQEPSCELRSGRFTSNQPRRRYLIYRVFNGPTLTSHVIISSLIYRITPSALPRILHPNIAVGHHHHATRSRGLCFLRASPIGIRLPFTKRVRLRPSYPSCTGTLVLTTLRRVRTLNNDGSTNLN